LLHRLKVQEFIQYKVISTLYMSSSSLLHVTSTIHHYHPALLHRPALILDGLLTYLVVFSTLFLNLCFSQSLCFHSYLSLIQADLEL